MTLGEHINKTIRLAYPVCIGQLGHILVTVVDTAMVGQVGTKEQAAAALANSLYILLLMFGIGISYGCTPLIASAHSRGDKEEIAGLLKNSILLNCLTGSLLFLLLFLLSPLLRFMNQPPDVVEMSIPFLNVLMLSLVPLCFFQSYKQFAEGLSDTRAAMLIGLVANLLNFLLNYILIFGKLGLPAMGLMGSCWATFISRVIMSLLMFLYVHKSGKYRVYISCLKETTLSMLQIKRIAAIGVPSGLQFVFEVGAFSCAAIMTGWIGARELAAHQIALSVAAITYMAASGISAAAAVRVGNSMGMNDRTQLRRAGFSAFLLSALFMACCGLILIAGRNYIPLLFNNEKEVIQISSSLLLIAAFFQLSDGIQVVGLGVLRGMKDAKAPTLITLVAYWILSLPLSYLFAFPMGMGIEGIWFGLLAGLTFSAIMLFGRFQILSKRLVS